MRTAKRAAAPMVERLQGDFSQRLRFQVAQRALACGLRCVEDERREGYTTAGSHQGHCSGR
jgi:hypothetical protein